MRTTTTTSIYTEPDAARTSCQDGHAISDVAIMIRANQNWVAAGKPKGDGRRFWLEAERELRHEAEQSLRRAW